MAAFENRKPDITVLFIKIALGTIVHEPQIFSNFHDLGIHSLQQVFIPGSPMLFNFKYSWTDLPINLRDTFYI